jgi:hypothetical protein
MDEQEDCLPDFHRRGTRDSVAGNAVEAARVRCRDIGDGQDGAVPGGLDAGPRSCTPITGSHVMTPNLCERTG